VDSIRIAVVQARTQTDDPPKNVGRALAYVEQAAALGASPWQTARDVLLPVLLYPITVPVIIAGVRATATLLQPELDMDSVRFWLALLGCFDVVFVTLALWTFEPLMTD